MSKSLRADLALLTISIFWGVTFPLIRQAVTQINPFQFVFTRFLFATTLFALFLWAQKAIKRLSKTTAMLGVGLGFIIWVAYLSQTIGLETIPSGRAAFVTGLNVILVPLLAPFFRAGAPNRIDFLAAIFATVGLYLMADPSQGGLSIGDAWILLCAIFCAFHILLLQKILARAELDRMALTFFQMLGVLLFSSFCLPFGHLHFPTFHPQVWTALLFCSLFATVGTFWLQTRFQGDTTPQRTALIFALEPVFAAIFGFILLDETMNLKGVLGGSLILISIGGSEFMKAKA